MDTDSTVSQPTALWCPYCRAPFVGTVELRSGRFAHPACGRVAVLDIERLGALAADGRGAEAWFWRRYQARLLAPPPVNEGPEGLPAA
ncbi:MAG TPA: hypothetical protein VF763_14535 [Candidatus Limnocylindrales bacterium]